MKLISWNVNGIRAVLKKNFIEFCNEHDPDILCLQETKARSEQVDIPLDLAKYKTYWYSAEKPGYSSTAIFTKTAPLSIKNGIGIDAFDKEGRVITAEFDTFYLVTVYTPNAQNELARIDFRMTWDIAFLNFVKELEKTKPVIFCGDLNVAHKEIDLARPKPNVNKPGFSPQERAAFDRIVEAGFVDTFRHFYPELEEAYSWWSYRGGARAKNVGWRIDYFCVSQSFMKNVTSASILHDVMDSDHCPVQIELTV